MTPARWQQVKVILEDALELETERREAFLASVCGADTELRQEVATLLEGAADRFLETPPIGPPRVPDLGPEPAPIQGGSVPRIRPGDLPPYTKLVVSTARTRYLLTIIAPLDLECLIVGGSQFEQPTRVRLPEVVAVGTGLSLRSGLYRINTTPVERIEIGLH